MGDLISREAAVKALMEQADRTKDAKSDVRVSVFFESAACTIQQMPVVDAEPVRHGHWINRGYVCGEYKWECSVCGESEWRGSTIGLYYCPNCGAKMEGVEK